MKGADRRMRAILGFHENTIGSNTHAIGLIKK
jgi:hypothetical protein